MNMHINLEEKHKNIVYLYSYSISFIMLICTIISFITSNNSKRNFFFLLFSLTFFFFPFIRMYLKKYYLLLIYFILGIFCTYYSCAKGIKSGFVLYFFPIISSIPFVFNQEKDKKIIYGLFSFLFLILTVLIISDFSLFPKENSKNDILDEQFFIETLYQSFTIVFINVFFLIKKEEIFVFYYKNFVSQNKKYKKLSKQIDARIGEVIELAKNNDDSFLSNFKEVFPDFYNKLIYEYPDLTMSEIKISALLMLNFSTKEISNYSHLSVRTIETKKYNLRKKINIPSDVNLNIFMNTLIKNEEFINNK